MVSSTQSLKRKRERNVLYPQSGSKSVLRKCILIQSPVGSHEKDDGGAFVCPDIKEDENRFRNGLFLFSSFFLIYCIIIIIH